jgi:hypothetical protein
MTGLTRKEVRRIRTKTDASEHTVVMKTAPASQILHRWYTDNEFLTESGRPSDLSFDGDGVTFTLLVKKHGGDVPPGAMRTELKRMDALEITKDGKLRPIKRIAYNVDLHDRLIGGLAGIIYPAALNLAHNLETEDSSERWANLAATSRFVRNHDRGRIMRISFDRIKEFVETIDDVYGAFEKNYDQVDSDENEKTVGVGVFYFEEDKSDTDIF